MCQSPAPIDVAYTLHVRGRLAEAEARYRAIIAHGEGALDAASNLLYLLRQTHRWDDAERLIREIAEQHPESSTWRFRLFNALASGGRFPEAWPHFESRRASIRDRVTAPSLSFPEWKGEPVKSLLVWPEQGLGDQIQFARYVPALKARGIAVTLVCSPVLARLFSPLETPIIPAAGAVSIPRHDAWALIGSLPWRMGTNLDNIPPPAPLAGRPTRSGGIGVVTRGSPSHVNDANRSLPEKAAARLLSLPGVVNLDPSVTGARDFQDTADIIAGLDLVISVDSAPAHLAASLGKPTWILLPAIGTDWRWLRDRSDSPWYPSATLWRQERFGGWFDVASAVAERVGSPAQPQAEKPPGTEWINASYPVLTVI